MCSYRRYVHLQSKNDITVLAFHSLSVSHRDFLESNDRYPSRHSPHDEGAVRVDHEVGDGADGDAPGQRGVLDVLLQGRSLKLRSDQRYVRTAHSAIAE